MKAKRLSVVIVALLVAGGRTDGTNRGPIEVRVRSASDSVKAGLDRGVINTGETLAGRGSDGQRCKAAFGVAAVLQNVSGDERDSTNCRSPGSRSPRDTKWLARGCDLSRVHA